MLLVRKVMHHLFACLKRHRWCGQPRRAAAAAASPHTAARAPAAQGARDAGLRGAVPRGEGAHGASPAPQPLSCSARSCFAPFAARSRPPRHVTRSPRSASARWASHCTPSTSFSLRWRLRHRRRKCWRRCCVPLSSCSRTQARPSRGMRCTQSMASCGRMHLSHSCPSGCAGHPRIADRVRTAVFEPLAAGDGDIDLAPPQLQARAWLPRGC